MKPEEEEKYSRLLKRYQEGLTTSEENERIEEWYKNLDSSIIVSNTEEARRTLTEAKWAEWSARQLSKTTDTPFAGSVINRRLKAPDWKWAAAASVVIMLITGYILTSHSPWNPWQSTHQIMASELSNGKVMTRFNDGDQPMVIVLEDHSRINLMPGSSLKYPETFDKNDRKVLLSGDAFFEITKNPSKPFYVYSGDVVTKVLGTSFMIRSDKKTREVRVSVRTGRVSVYQVAREGASSVTSDPETTGILLTPNQQAVYQSREGKLIKSLVESPALIAPEEKASSFSFVNTPVSQIFEAIEKAYGVDLVFDEEVFKDCFLTTSLEDEDLFEKLTVISKLLNVNYKIIDTHIVISGAGCKHN